VRQEVLSMATMTDVANVAGCSTTTVSHVLNGTRTVAAQTRRQVERAIEQVGYQRRITRPGYAPRHLSAVGLTLPLGGNPYFGEVVQGVEQELTRAGRVLVVADTHDCPETERRALASLLAHRIEAFVMVPTANWQERSWPLLAERGTPFVLMDRMIEGDFDQIGVENESGSRKLVEHLLAIGHRKVGMITGLPGLSTTAERKLGYLRAHRLRRVETHRSLIECGESGVDGGRRAMLRLLDRGVPPTAVFVGNNAMTVGALTALAERRILVPSGMAIVAFDDFEWSKLIQPGLTVAAQPCHAIGARAVQLLLSKLSDPNLTARSLRVPASIEHRASCGCGLAKSQLARIHPRTSVVSPVAELAVG
jgi:LacI family transcriptional regulator